MLWLSARKVSHLLFFFSFRSDGEVLQIIIHLVSLSVYRNSMNLSILSDFIFSLDSGLHWFRRMGVTMEHDSNILCICVVVAFGS